MAQEGNTFASWDKLFKAGVVSAAQVLANFRSLILLNYPQETLKKILAAKSDTLNVIKILKLRQFIVGVFTEDVLFLSLSVLMVLKVKLINLVQFLVAVDQSKDEVIKKMNGKTKPYYNLKMPPQIFKDAKGTTAIENVFRGAPPLFALFTISFPGKTTEKEVVRIVHADFDKKVVTSYLNFLTDLLEVKSAKFAPTVAPSKCRSVILLTSELRNSMRAGMPPSIPSYSRASLWRNEVPPPFSRLFESQHADSSYDRAFAFSSSLCLARSLTS